MTQTTESDRPVGEGIDQSPTSQPAGVQQTSPGSVELKTVLDRLDNLERLLQSDKDKAVARTNRRLQQIQDELAQVKPYLDEFKEIPAAARAIALDRLLNDEPQGKAPVFPATTPQVSGQVPVQSDMDVELLALLGIDQGDPRLIAEMAGGKPWQEAAKTVAKAKQQASAPNPAGIQPTGGAAPAASNQAALTDAFNKEMSQVRKGDWQTGEAIKAKYRRKGLNVY